MRVKLPKHGMVPIALNMEKDITVADLKVYVALSSFQGSNDDSFPSREAIVERTGLVVETVSRAVSHLVSMGWIQRIRRPNQSSIYRVLMETDDDSEMTNESLPDQSGNDQAVMPEMTNESLPSIELKEHLKKSAKKQPETRHKHGEYKHVLLTDSELDRFKADFPLDWEQRIRSCDEYCQQYGKKYADYNLTMRKWARKEQSSQPTATPLFPTVKANTEMTEMDLRMLKVAQRS